MLTSRTCATRVRPDAGPTVNARVLDRSPVRTGLLSRRPSWPLLLRNRATASGFKLARSYCGASTFLDHVYFETRSGWRSVSDPVPPGPAPVAVTPMTTPDPESAAALGLFTLPRSDWPCSFVAPAVRRVTPAAVSAPDSCCSRRHRRCPRHPPLDPRGP
jgi:hypothetical protein